MNDRQYNELLDAIPDLRGASELGFTVVNRRLDELQHGLDTVRHGLDHVNGRIDAVCLRLDEADDRWDHRFDALELRVEDGFRGVSGSLREIHTRLISVEPR
jgi:hypothetical protein